MKRTALFFVMAALMLTGTAHAVIITGSQIATGSGPGATFTAAPGDLTTKSQAGFTGAGVTGGPSGPEIDIGESITGVFALPAVINFMQLMVLYEGPEYGDYQEKAKVTANLFGGGTLVGLLETVYSPGGTLATWTFGAVSNVSPALDGPDFGGVWRIDNPFGSSLVTSLVFEAIPGTCAPEFNCNNQSDYAIESLGYEPVPEPGTLLLIGSGLAGMAFRRRRRQ